MTDAEREAQIRKWAKVRADDCGQTAVFMCRRLDEARAERDDAYRRCREAQAEIARLTAENREPKP